MKKVAVYCGASEGNEDIYKNSAVQLGEYLAKHNLELVYGGGGVGLMGLLANTVLDNGGVVHGIMPKELMERGASLDRLEDLEVVDNMSTRKKLMLERADGCIALPGGPGTLEEIVEAFSWARLGDNINPCVFYNVSGYYDPMKSMFDSMVNKEFLTSYDRDKLLFSDSLENIFEFMENYIPPKIRQYK